MALLNPTFIFGIFVLLYLSSFVLFAVLRIVTGISIQRIGYFSLRRLAYTPKDGVKIQIRGLGLNIHRPTFAQPTWLSVVITELAVTVDLKALEGSSAEAEASEDGDGEEAREINDPAKCSLENEQRDTIPRLQLLRRATGSIPRSETWKKLMHMKERIKKMHRNVNWLRMVDVVATNSTINVVDVGNVQFGSLTVAVDTRRKMVDRARFFFQSRADKKKQQHQAEWIVTLRSVLFTPDGKESLEVLDHATLNIHGFLYEALDGLRDAAIALKLGRLHIPYDEVLLCADRYKKHKNPFNKPFIDAESVEVSINSVIDELAEPGSTDYDLMQTVSDSKEFVSSILRGIKEVQFAVSFLGITKKIESVKPAGSPVLLTASMKEVGIDLHRLDPKSPAHRMYFPSKDIAHEALAAALSISIGVDDGQGKPERIFYVPMATTTVKTTLPSKTVELSEDGSPGQKNANILFANSVVTSPSVDLDPRHLPLLLTLLRPKPKAAKVPSNTRHVLISRLLPKANIKLSLHEPVIRVTLPPVEPTADPDDFDLIISSITSISLDVESFHSEIEDLHYSLASSLRLQSHDLYYQTSSSSRFNLMQTESFDVKINLSANPDVHVVATSNLQSFSVKMVRPEITDGLRQIVRQLRLDVEPDKYPTSKSPKPRNFLRAMPQWLLQFQIQAQDFSVEVAGIDEHHSDESRGVTLNVETWAGEYRAQRFEGLRRRPSRRRARSRSLTPDTDLLNKAPFSPIKKQLTPGDGRRLSLSMRGLEAYVIEASERFEIEPFISMPKFEATLSTLSDSHGPVFHIHSHMRSLTVHYSLYRHYSVGIASTVLRKAFLRTNRDKAERRGSYRSPKSKPDMDFLSPPTSPDSILGDNYDQVKELVTADVKASRVQVKFDMPNDPPVMLHVYNMDMGLQRFAPPYCQAKLIRLYVEAPRMNRVWVRMISIKQFRLEYREARKKNVRGHSMERMFDIGTEAIRVAVPHEVIVHRITDNFINVVKSVQQLHHRFKTGTDEDILDKGPEGPKNVPKLSFSSRSLLFELEDGAFEWKLGMIYRAGRLEQVQRLAREEAFRIKVKKIHEQESRKESRFRNRSAMPRGRGRNSGNTWARSHSEEGRPRRNTNEDTWGRRPRYDPDGAVAGLSSSSHIPIADARYKLHVLNAQSWKKRIDRQYTLAKNAVKDVRGDFWGQDQLPDDVEDSDHILEVPERAALLSALLTDVHLHIDKPSFPLKDLPNYLHDIGKGMPKDMKYSLLVPMHVQIDLGEAKLSLRDYPLPFIHIPALKPDQAFKHALTLKTNFVIAEEFHGPESSRVIKVNIVPPRNFSPTGSSSRDGFEIPVRRTIGPVKTYSDMRVDVNTANPTRITWGPSLQPAIQDMMMVIESFTKPQLDPSDRVGFWDKIRLNFHSRMRIAWKGDGDVHLALKGTRDPYLVTGHGAGLLGCWRNDVSLSINAGDDAQRLLAVDSGEFILAIPDFSQQVREAERRNGDKDSFNSEDSYTQGAAFQKVVMKLSGKVQWLAGLVFEQAINNGGRCFEFKPHYDVVLKEPQFARPQDGLPYDAFRGFRSEHIHLSLDIRAPADREWTVSNPDPSRSYNTAHFTPRFFTHFFAWWSLFSGPLSLPIRQGSLWPGREKNSKKFGRHLGTIKYNLLLAPLFLSHIYKHKELEDHSTEDHAVSATGIKVRFDSFMLDIHQRREEFNTQDRGRKTQSRTTGMKIHAAQLDLVSVDIRAVSASIKGSTADAIRRGSLSAFMADAHEDPTHFTIPDNDFSWVDMDDFVELDWILPTGASPDTKILPLACAPRVTYFRQTDIGGIIAGDPDRTSPFGQEPTHLCIMSQDDDPRRVQVQLIQDRLAQLRDQIDTHSRNVNEAQLKVVRGDGQDEKLRREYDALVTHTNVLQDKKGFLESMLEQMNAIKSPVENGHPALPKVEGVADTSIELEEGDIIKIPSGAQFASDFNNRFVVHNMQLKWNNLLRNIILRYIHQVSQRRGFVYYLSRPAVKFILDIVEEQTKAKRSNVDNSGSSSKRAPSAAATSKTGSEADVNDIEARIHKILEEGKKFVKAGNSGADAPAPGTMQDLSGGIAEGFTPQNSYHVRLIAPQIQLQSEKNKKHVVLVTAKGMELKVVEVMDKDRLSDMVSGTVQRRFLVGMDGAQFFVTHQKWFSTQLLSMYSGSTYGTPVGSSWPPWVPMEVMFDFNTNPFGFKRVVQQTSATLRYDKYNTLRLKYNDEINSDGNFADSPEDNPESRMDNLWVEFPQARALCNSSQYFAMYVIIVDLLMYNEPAQKTRSERLEKIMLASDFSDLRGTPELVTKLQERIRQLEEIKTHFQIHSKYLDKKGWEDRLLLERDLAACEDELFFMMKAITTSQRKHDTTAASQSTAFLRWTLSAKEIVWHLIRDNNEPLVELQLKDVEYDKVDNSDGSHNNLIRVGKILGLNLLPDAMYPQMIGPFMDPEGRNGLPVLNDGREMIRVYWYMLESIAGIPVMDHFEVRLFPMKIQLERDVGKKLFEYIFPGMEGDESNSKNVGERSDSPFMLRQGLEEDGDAESTLGSSTISDKDSGSFSTRPGSLELRLRPTLNSEARPTTSASKQVAHSTYSAESQTQGSTFRGFFRSKESKPPTKKRSHESLSSFANPRPVTARIPTGLTNRETSTVSTATDASKKSRFTLKSSRTQPDDKPSDDLTKMMSRASNYMSFAIIRMPSVVLCLSYKGQKEKNIEDVHDFVFRLPTIEYRNKTWSNLDLALALKSRVIKALISHTGAIIGNKFSRHRPNTTQQTRLREIATSSVLLATPGFGAGRGQSPAGKESEQESANSDDSSSAFGVSPVDFSRSPPRSLRSTQTGIPVPSNGSRSSSVASARSYRTTSTGDGPPGGPSSGPSPAFGHSVAISAGTGQQGQEKRSDSRGKMVKMPHPRQHPGVPSFLMMTPPSPIERTGSAASGALAPPRSPAFPPPRSPAFPHSSTSGPSSGAFGQLDLPRRPVTSHSMLSGFSTHSADDGASIGGGSTSEQSIGEKSASGQSLHGSNDLGGVGAKKKPLGGTSSGFRGRLNAFTARLKEGREGSASGSSGAAAALRGGSVNDEPQPVKEGEVQEVQATGEGQNGGGDGKRRGRMRLLTG